MRTVQLSQTKSLQRGHPWVFSGAIEAVDLLAGELVKLQDSNQRTLAVAYASPQAKVRLRVLEWKEVVIDASWWKSRIQAAWNLRAATREHSTAWRLIHAEADGLPGLIVDYYDGYLSLQAQTQGLEQHVESIIQGLVDVVSPKGIYERSDSPYRSKEGLGPRSGLVWGELPPDHLWVHEHGIDLCISLTRGQKSGHYCDQRENRRRFGAYCKGKRVLDLCCNSGGFALQALHQGASEVVCVDSSAGALEMLKVNLTRSRAASKAKLIQGDIGKVMEQLQSEGERFDCIILDPPKLAPQRSDLEKAQRAYKALNRRALELLNPEGYLATFSCSAAVSIEQLQTMVAWASLEVPCQLRRCDLLLQPADHPVVLHFPESEYLKGVILQRL